MAVLRELISFWPVLGLAAIAALLYLAVARARSLSRRIAEQRAEDANGPKDPYAHMAEVWRVQEAIAKATPAQPDQKRQAR